MNQPADIFILNVGAGSCVVVRHPSGRCSMIDINNGQELRELERQAFLAEGFDGRIKLAAAEQKLVNPIEWYAERFDSEIWRFILSHPDADHMAGLRCILRRETIGTAHFWDLTHTKETTEFQNEKAEADWIYYQAMRLGAQVQGLSWPQVLNLERGDVAQYWDQDQIEILSPSKLEIDFWNEREKWNEMSYVLRVGAYGRSVIIPGDVEEVGWAATADEVADMHTDVLVASHHGRKNGFPENGVMERMNPSAVVISTGPLPREHDATERYRRAVNGNVYSTRKHGTLQIRIWPDGSLAIAEEVGGAILFGLPALPYFSSYAA